MLSHSTTTVEIIPLRGACESHLDGGDEPRPPDGCYGDVALLQLAQDVVRARQDAHGHVRRAGAAARLAGRRHRLAGRAGHVTDQPQVGVLPQLDDLAEHLLQGRLVARHRRDLLYLGGVSHDLRNACGRVNRVSGTQKMNSVSEAKKKKKKLIFCHFYKILNLIIIQSGTKCIYARGQFHEALAPY